MSSPVPPPPTGPFGTGLGMPSGGPPPGPYPGPGMGTPWPGAGPSSGRRASSDLNVIGAIVGPLATLLAVWLGGRATTEMARSMQIYRRDGVEFKWLLAVAACGALFGAVAWAGRWAPLAPIVSGALLVVVGLIAGTSWEVTRRIVDLVPGGAAFALGVSSWIFAGTIILLGFILLGAGLAALRR